MLKLSFFSRIFLKKKKPKKNFLATAKYVPFEIRPRNFQFDFFAVCSSPSQFFWKSLQPQFFFKNSSLQPSILLGCKNAKTWFKFPSSLLTLTTLLSVQKLKLGFSDITLNFFTNDLAQLFNKKKCQNAGKNSFFLIISYFLYGYSNSVKEARKIIFQGWGRVIKSSLLLDNPKKISCWEENKFLDYRNTPTKEKFRGEKNSLELPIQIGSFARI